jgi:hypothetical protein
MTNQQSQNARPVPGQDLPWYRQFWPWFIIALPASVVVASFVTLWLAISNPDPLVIEDNEYRKLNGELKAQAPEQESEKGNPD